MIPDEAFEGLSLTACGVFAYIAYREPRGGATRQDIIDSSADDAATVDAALRELKAAGHISSDEARR